jgi:toxin CcdB
MAIPLMPLASKKQRMSRLHLIVTLEGGTYVLVPELMAAIERRSLGSVVTSLADRQHEIVNAIDFLLQGF